MCKSQYGKYIIFEQKIIKSDFLKIKAKIYLKIAF